MISLDFMPKVNNFSLVWLKSGFEVTISLDFLFKVMIFANFGLKSGQFSYISCLK